MRAYQFLVVAGIILFPASVSQCHAQSGEPTCPTQKSVSIPLGGGGMVCWFQYEECGGSGSSMIAGDCASDVCECAGTACNCGGPSGFQPGPPAHFEDEFPESVASHGIGDAWRTTSMTQVGAIQNPATAIQNRSKKVKANRRLSTFATKLKITMADALNPAGWPESKGNVVLAGFGRHTRNGIRRHFALYEVTLPSSVKHYVGIRVEGTPDQSQKVFPVQMLGINASPGVPSTIEGVVRAPGPDSVNNGAQYRKYYHILGIDTN